MDFICALIAAALICFTRWCCTSFSEKMDRTEEIVKVDKKGLKYYCMRDKPFFLKGYSHPDFVYGTFYDRYTRETLIINTKIKPGRYLVFSPSTHMVYDDITPACVEETLRRKYGERDEDIIEEGLLIDTGEKWSYTEFSKQALYELYKIHTIKYRDLERMYRYETDTGRIFITYYNGVGSYLKAPDKSDNEKLFVKKYPRLDQYGNFIKKRGVVLYDEVTLTKQEYIDCTIPLWFRFIESKGEE